MDDEIQMGAWVPTMADLERLWRVAERSAYAVLRNGVHASDAADEALGRFLKEPWQERQDCQQLAWIQTTAENIARDYLRTRKHTTESCDPARLDACPEDDAVDRDFWALWRTKFRDLLPRLRSRLTPLQSKVLTRVMANWTTAQIAADLGKPEPDIRRARRAIIREAKKLL